MLPRQTVADCRPGGKNPSDVSAIVSPLGPSSRVRPPAAKIRPSA